MRKKSEKGGEEEQKESTELPVKLKENWILQHTFHREWIKHSIVEKKCPCSPEKNGISPKNVSTYFFFFFSSAEIITF